MVQQKGMELASVGKPTTGMKIQGPNEWYNDKYESSSRSLAPNVFRPPKETDPTFKDYFNFVFGKGQYEATGSIDLTQAPNYNAAKTSDVPFEQGVIALVEDGASWPKIFSGIKTKVTAGNLTYPEGMDEKTAIAYAKDIWDEYNKVVKNAKADPKAYSTKIATDDNFRYGMPDPRLKYGTMTNFGVGVVDVLTNPNAKKLYDAYAKQVKDTRKLAQYKAYLANELTKAGFTPWKDEAARRDKLKGTKYGD